MQSWILETYAVSRFLVLSLCYWCLAVAALEGFWGCEACVGESVAIFVVQVMLESLAQLQEMPKRSKEFALELRYLGLFCSSPDCFGFKPTQIIAITFGLEFSHRNKAHGC